MLMRVKKNDNVMVVSGKYKGKQGVVIAISPKAGKVKVKGVAIATRHLKPRKQGDQAGVVKSEAFIELSNVMPVCGSCNAPTRVGVAVVEQNKKVRSCKRCNETF